jgi:hypothetical protein
LLGASWSPEPVGNIAFSASDLLVTEHLGGGALTVFVASSASSGTNWVGAFGSEGYDLAGWNGECDVSNLPDASGSGYCDPKEPQVKLTFHEAYTGNLRLYAVDWGKGGGRRRVH